MDNELNNHRYLSICGFQDRVSQIMNQLAEELPEITGLTTCTQDPDKEGEHSTCAVMEWLQKRNTAFSPILDEFPFLKYAGSLWTFHASHQDRALDCSSYAWLFNEDSNIFQRWKDLNGLFGGLLINPSLSLKQSEITVSKLVSTVLRGKASQLDIVALIRRKYRVTSIPKTHRTDRASLLMEAADIGDCDVVRRLSQDADEDSLRDAITSASVKGHHEVVSILLDRGAEATLGVVAAGFNGHEKVMHFMTSIMTVSTVLVA